MGVFGIIVVYLINTKKIDMAKQKLKSKTSGGVKLKAKAAPKKKASTAKKKKY